MTRLVLGTLAALLMTCGLSELGVWLYIIAFVVWALWRGVREFRRAYRAILARQAADEATRQAADRLAQAVDVRRIARRAALMRATQRAA